MDTASDIDILVIGDHNTIQLQKELATFRRAIDREINLITVSQTEYDEKMENNDPLFKDIMNSPLIEIL